MSLFSTIDEINISTVYFKDDFDMHGLYRRKNESDTIDIVSFLTDQLEGLWRLHHLNWIQAGYIVAKKKWNYYVRMWK